MNTYFWRRWAELDQLVRQLALLHPPFLRKLADAPPHAIHVIAIYLRSTSWGHLCANAKVKHPLNLQDANVTRTLRDQTNAATLAALAQHICRESHERLIVAAIPTVPTTLLLKVLNRCGNDVHAPDFYEHLVVGLSHPESSTLLCDITGQIEPRDLMQLEQARSLDPILHATFCRRRFSLQIATALNRLLQVVRHFHGPDYDNVFADAFTIWEDPERDRHINRLLNRLPGAPPPWNGDDKLVPIHRPRELSEVARRFQNCLAHFRLEHIFGQMAFYEWQSDKVPAIVALRYGMPFGWELDDIKGVRNGSIPQVTRTDINARIAAAGFGMSISSHYAIGRMRGDLFFEANDEL